MFFKFTNFKKHNLIFYILIYTATELLIFPGCHYQKTNKNIIPEIKSREELVNRIKDKSPIEDLKIFGKGEINGRKGKKKFNIAILLKRPGFHNLQILSPFGNPLATISGNNIESYLTDFRNKEVILSTPPEKIIFRITGYRGSISNLIDFVCARIPVNFNSIIYDYQTSVDISGKFYKIRMNNYNSQQIEYFIDKNTLMPAKATIFDKYNNSSETISYSGNIVNKEEDFPSDITFTNSKGIETFRLHINEISINNDIPVSKFDFQNPMNFTIKEIAE